MRGKGAARAWVPQYHPAPARRVLAVLDQPHRPGWYTLVWREHGQQRRESLSRELCLTALDEAGDDSGLAELWRWRLAQLPSDPRGPGRPTTAPVQAEPVAPTTTGSTT